MSEGNASSLVCVKCEDEPEAAKVIIVVEDHGEHHAVERRYAADEIDDHTDFGRLRIKRDGRQIASYNVNAWLSVREDGALADDIKPKARRLQSALRRVAMAEQPVTVEILQGIARECLQGTGWDEEDL